MRTLVFAYACEPDRGSEPGAGWYWSRMLATVGEATVITRANNRDAIERAIASTPERGRLRFVYVDLPRWARFWKRGQRGIHLYYLLWQLAALRVGRRLHRAAPFDVAWHLTMANVWMGSLAPFVGAPFVHGPIGGGVRTPWRLLGALGLRGVLGEVTYKVAQGLGRRLNPLTRVAWRRASLILVQNPETRAWLPSAHRHKCVVFPNAVVDAAPAAGRASAARPPTALYAGRLLPAKGTALAIRAMAELPGWELLVCGTGPDERRLRRVAHRHRVADRVTFTGWLTRPELAAIMVERADVMVFPSLHDHSPWVLHEARTAGLRVVCLDGCGSTLLATVVVDVGWPGQTSRAIARGARAAIDMPRPAREHFDLATRRAVLERVLRDHGLPVASFGADEHSGT